MGQCQNTLYFISFFHFVTIYYLYEEKKISFTLLRDYLKRKRELIVIYIISESTVDKKDFILNITTFALFFLLVDYVIDKYQT